MGRGGGQMGQQKPEMGLQALTLQVAACLSASTVLLLIGYSSLIPGSRHRPPGQIPTIGSWNPEPTLQKMGGSLADYRIVVPVLPSIANYPTTAVYITVYINIRAA